MSGENTILLAAFLKGIASRLQISPQVFPRDPRKTRQDAVDEAFREMNEREKQWLGKINEQEKREMQRLDLLVHPLNFQDFQEIPASQ